MLYPRTLSLPYGGDIYTASPNVAVNVAVTAGLFSLPLAAHVPPAMRIYAPFDHPPTTVTATRLTALVALGGAIKVAQWHYADYLDSEVVIPHASDDDLVVAVVEEAEELDDNFYLLDSTLDLDIDLGDILRVEDSLGEDDTAPAQEEEDDGEHNGMVVIILGTGKDGLDVEFGTRKSKSLEFTSPLVYSHWLEECEVPEDVIGNTTRKEEPPVLGFSAIISSDDLDFAARVIVNDTGSDFMVGINTGGGFMALFDGLFAYHIAVMASFGSLALLLIALLVYRTRASQGPSMRLMLDRWTTSDPPIGSHRVLVGEFWYRRRTIWRVNHFIDMGYRSYRQIAFGPVVPEGSEFRAKAGYEAVLYVLESLAVATMWVSIKVLGETVCKETLERTFAEHGIPYHTRRYLRYLLYPKPVVDVSRKLRRTRMGRTGRRRGQQQLERELFGDRVHKGYRRSITKVVASGVSLCALVLSLWSYWEDGGAG